MKSVHILTSLILSGRGEVLVKDEEVKGLPELVLTSGTDCVEELPGRVTGDQTLEDPIDKLPPSFCILETNGCRLKPLGKLLPEEDLVTSAERGTEEELLPLTRLSC